MERPGGRASGYLAPGVGFSRAGRPAAAECGVYPMAPGPAARHDRFVANVILIVDDSPSFHAAAAGLLAERGFEVAVRAYDGEQALAAVASGRPDGILLDIGLPGPDGFKVAASLAAACPGIRIVLTSAEFGQLPAGVLESSPAVAFVPKDQLAVTDLGALFAA
jgi:CheY-like chemotaxis protein